MYEWRLVRLLLLPSMLSGVLSYGAAFAFIGYFSWQYIQDNKFFYDYLFGMYGVREYVGSKPTGLMARVLDFFSSDVAYIIIVAALAAVVGFMIYAVLQGIALLKKRAQELSGELQFSGYQHDDLVAEFVTRTALRIMSVLGWGLYAAFFSNTIMQVTLLLTEIGVTSLQHGNMIGILQVLLAVTVLAAGLHVHVLFLRLCLLRPRVFGSNTQAEEIEASIHRL